MKKYELKFLPDFERDKEKLVKSGDIQALKKISNLTSRVSRAPYNRNGETGTLVGR
jgi:Txe/YoeB family toxin of Txe-Axe toxin-antitoxin module